jgi:hypothetical protein
MRLLPRPCPLRSVGGPKPIGFGPGLRTGSGWARFARVYVGGAVRLVHSVFSKRYNEKRLEEKEKMMSINLLLDWWLERNHVREGESRRTATDLGYIVASLSDEFLTSMH